MNSGGVTDRIYGFARALVGHFTGGLGHVNVMGSLIFSGMSGSAIADAGGLGILEIKAMKEDGYPGRVRGRAHLRVLHHRAARAAVDPDGDLRRDRQHVGRRAVPRRHRSRAAHGGRPDDPRVLLGAEAQLSAPSAGESAAELWAAFSARSSPLVTPVIIMGGIFGGIFTPTEAAAVAASTRCCSACSIYRDAGFRDLPRDLQARRSTSRRWSASSSPARACSAGCWRASRCRSRWPRLFLGISRDPLVVLLDHQRRAARPRLLHGGHGDHDPDGARCCCR